LAQTAAVASQQPVKAECNVLNEFAVKEYLFLSKWGYHVNGSGQFSD
jgi:hypothetical protein